MRIGVISSVSATLDSFFEPLVAAWRSEGHQVFLASGTESGVFDSQVLTGLTRRPSFSNVYAHRQLCAWASHHKLSVIVTSTATASVLARFPRLNVPVVYFCHGLHWNKGTTIIDRVWMTIEQAMIRNTHAVLCMNSDDYRWFRERMDEDRIHFLDFGVGVPLQQYTPVPLPKTNTLQLLWAGEFSDRKRPELMLDIARHLGEMGVHFHLAMLGKGARHIEIAERVAEMNLEEVVSLPGHVSIQDYLKSCHVFVHTSLWEGLPRVMLEALAMRRQSIAFDVKGARDIPDVLLVPDGMTKMFAERIRELSNEIRNADFILPPAPGDLESAVVARDISDFLESVL